MLNADLAKKMDAALSATESVLKKLKAENKKLLALRDEMVKAVAGYRSSHNDMLSKISRGTIGGLPGGIKMLQKQADKEFSGENQAFVEGAMKVSNDAVKIMTYMGSIDVSSLNITNSARWKALEAERAAWEKEVKLAIKTSLKDIVLVQEDTIGRLVKSSRL